MESPVFVGRTAEFERVTGVIDAARAGSGATALVVGEAGIGKTRLVSRATTHARGAGFEVLVGRCVDLIGTQLPYQPFVEALRQHGGLHRVDSQLELFEQALALLTDRAAAAPVLMVLEDVHWADISTLDLLTFLAHNLDGRRIALLATCRADEPASAERVRRLRDGVRRSGAGLTVDLGPLRPADLATLLAARAGDPLPPARLDEITARSEGNPFFAEELLAADGAGVPGDLRDLLLHRLAPLSPATRGLLRLASAAGRRVGYPLLRAVAGLPEPELRESLRQATEFGVLVATPANGGFRFRHALLAEAVYSTLLPGEREEAHESLAEELARDPAAAPAELAQHWAAAGRAAETLVASIDAARQAQEVFGLAEALAHLERALSVWDAVPDGARKVDVELAELCEWTAEMAWHTGASPRAVDLQQRTIDLAGDDDTGRAALLYEHLGRYLFASGRGDEALTAVERSVALLPAHPPSPQRAKALAALGAGLMLDCRHGESLAACEEAVEVAREVGDGQAELRALGVLGIDLAYLGRGDEGLAQLWETLRRAEDSADHLAQERVYSALTDVLMMLGRPREAARLAERALDALRPFGRDHSTIVANWIEPLVACGDWDTADRVSASALRAITANYPHQLLTCRAQLEAGRGQSGEARAHLDAARVTLRLDRDLACHALVEAGLALWDRRWTDAARLVTDGLSWARSRDMAQLRVWLGAEGLRAQAELAALARARRDDAAVRQALARADELIAVARAAAETSAVTPNSTGWLALAEAEDGRARGVTDPDPWTNTAATWERLERPPLAAYCHWRAAEALVTAGNRQAAGGLLKQAYTVAARIGATPLERELELLAVTARLDTASDTTAPDGARHLAAGLGLTPREAEVMHLIARGRTNREIAAELVISVRTAGVHVSRILHKLGAANRLEAAGIAQRLDRR